MLAEDIASMACAEDPDRIETTEKGGPGLQKTV